MLSGRSIGAEPLVPGLPAGVDDVIVKALSRSSPTGRYATAREMAIALEKCVGIASPSEVGEWVDTMAKDALSRRMRKVSEIESSSPSIAMPSNINAEGGERGDETPSSSTIDGISQFGALGEPARASRASLAGIAGVIGGEGTGSGIGPVDVARLSGEPSGVSWARLPTSPTCGSRESGIPS